jgi:hypothetical protein
MASAANIHLLVQGSDSKRYEREGVEISEHLTEEAAEGILNLFVLVSPLHLRDVADVVKAANRKKHLRGLFVEQGCDPHWATAMLDWADLRTLRNTLVHSDPVVFERVINAWNMDAKDKLIADATVQEDRLFVRTCALDTVEVELRALKPFVDAAGEDLLEFEIASDGAFIHWPSLDVHIDLESIRVAKDPVLKEKYKRARLQDDQALGRAIKILREKAGLRQKDIVGVSARQVRRIENGGVRARTETLRQFALAHDLDLNDYLNSLGEVMGGGEEAGGGL